MYTLYRGGHTKSVVHSYGKFFVFRLRTAGVGTFWKDKSMVVRLNDRGLAGRTGSCRKLKKKRPSPMAVPVNGMFGLIDGLASVRIDEAAGGQACRLRWSFLERVKFQTASTRVFGLGFSILIPPRRNHELPNPGSSLGSFPGLT